MGLLERAFFDPLLFAAYKVAEMAHRGQERMGGAPYLDHPVAVAEILLEYEGEVSSEILAAALMHDVLEDTSYPIQGMERIFPPQVVSLVKELTNAPRGEGQSKKDYFERIEKKWEGYSPEARLIKCADRLHNLRSMGEATWSEGSKRFYAEKALKMLKAFQFDGEYSPQVAKSLYDEAIKWCEVGE